MPPRAVGGWRFGACELTKHSSRRVLCAGCHCIPVCEEQQLVVAPLSRACNTTPARRRRFPCGVLVCASCPSTCVSAVMRQRCTPRVGVWDGSCIVLWALQRLGSPARPLVTCPGSCTEECVFTAVVAPPCAPRCPPAQRPNHLLWRGALLPGGGRLHGVSDPPPLARLDSGPHCIPQYVYKAQCACVCSRACAQPPGGSFDSSQGWMDGACAGWLLLL